MARKLTVQHPKSARSSVRVKRPSATAPGWEIMLIYFAFYGIIYLFKKLARREEDHE